MTASDFKDSQESGDSLRATTGQQSVSSPHSIILNLNDVDKIQCADKPIAINCPTKFNYKKIDVHSTQNIESISVSMLSRVVDSMLPWVAMVLAVIAAASIGPAFKYMEVKGISVCLAASWRCQCMAIFLIPLAIIEFKWNQKNRVDWFNIKPGLMFPVYMHVLFAGIAWSGNLLFWIIGLQYTTTFKASLISSCHPILLVMIMRCRGIQVSYLEWFGVLLSFAGMIISTGKEFFGSNAAASAVEEESHKYEFLGYILCFLAAASEIVVLLNRIATKKYVPLMQYSASTTVVVCVMSTLAALLLEGKNAALPGRHIFHESIDIFCQQDNCIFGWTSEIWAVKVLLFGLLVGVICIAGFNYAMQYIPPLIFSSIGLVDPATTAVLAWGIGVESLPSLLVWFGGVIVMAGVGIISIGDHFRNSSNNNNNSIQNKEEEDEEKKEEEEEGTGNNSDTSYEINDSSNRSNYTKKIVVDSSSSSSCNDTNQSMNISSTFGSAVINKLSATHSNPKYQILRHCEENDIDNGTEYDAVPSFGGNNINQHIKNGVTGDIELGVM